MSAFTTNTRPFQVGSVGWTAADLDDPEIERQWEMGRYEIIEGVLTELPAAYFDHGNAVAELMFLLRDHFRNKKIRGKWATEVDIIIDESRVLRADAVFMMPQERDRQQAEVRRRGRPDPRKSRVYVPPTLVIESVSAGHERHDRVTKRRWYAEFSVPNYWIVDAHAQSISCLQLHDGQYAEIASGHRNQTIRPDVFENVVIQLGDLWDP